MDALKKVGDVVRVRIEGGIYEGIIESITSVWSSDPRLSFVAEESPATALTRGLLGGKPIGTRYTIRCRTCSHRFLVEHYGEFVE